MTRPSVLLVNPRITQPKNSRLPLSLLSLGAVMEGRWPWRSLDGNITPDAAGAAVGLLDREPHALVGITVMPGPQVGPAIEVASAIRAAHPAVPIVWGGYFPTLYPDAAINAPYVDYVARGQGEDTLLELLERLPDADESALEAIRGLTWKARGHIRHNPDRPFRQPDDLPPLPYHRLDDAAGYLRPSFLGARTGVHQAATGCRYHCRFCGVVSMFNGHTRHQSPARFEQALATLRDAYGATAMQFYDNNFFDTEAASVPLLEVLERMQMPWWCYARADTLAGFSARTWDLIRRSRLRMAYIGAEAASDTVLRAMRKGTRVEHTLEVAARCREHGVIPEFSFVLGGPDDPECEVEKTLAFVRRVKRVHPACEVILYLYSPTPQRDPATIAAANTNDAARIPLLATYGPDGPPLPTTPEEWAEPRWVTYVCHQDAPWLSPRLRQRIHDFARVLACRFPTVQDARTPAWGKRVLRTAAAWRYATGRYEHPWELDLARRLIPLREPQKESL